MSLISNAKAAADLEQQVDRHAAHLVEHVMAGRYRAALHALANVEALDPATLRLACAVWVRGQLTDPAKETDR